MPGILDNILGRMRHQTSGAGGLLGGLGGGGGILSTAVGPLQARLATLQAAGTIQDKVKALSGTLGMRLKTPGGLLGGLGGGGSGGAPAPSTDASYQVSGIGRMFGNPEPPAGISFR
jgi:hypothetical protein